MASAFTLKTLCFMVRRTRLQTKRNLLQLHELVTKKGTRAKLESLFIGCCCVQSQDSLQNCRSLFLQKQSWWGVEVRHRNRFSRDSEEDYACEGSSVSALISGMMLSLRAWD